MRFVGICLVLLLSGCTLMKRQRVERQAVAQIDIPEFWRTSGEGNEGAISSGWLRGVVSVDRISGDSDGADRFGGLHFRSVRPS